MRTVGAFLALLVILALALTILLNIAEREGRAQKATFCHTLAKYERTANDSLRYEVLCGDQPR